MIFGKKETGTPPPALKLVGGFKEPSVMFDGESGELRVTGRCMPEDAKGFFKPLMEWLEQYKDAAQPETHLHINLEYFNTSSSKCMLDLMKAVQTIDSEGKSKGRVTWCYVEEDEDMLEVGENYQEMISLPFELKETEDNQE